jgi:Family of unknown function (DUF6152)
MRGARTAGLSLATLAALALGLGAAAQAHHNGYACLTRGASVTVEGQVEAFVFTMPHVVIRIRTAAGRLVTAEWMTVPQLKGMWGIAPDTLAPGDVVIVKGTPYSCEQDKMSLLASVTRPRDGWTWQSPLYH